MSLVKVRYKGLSDVRTMSREDLATRGVGVGADLHWEKNGRPLSNPVFLKDPSDELLEIFQAEGTFLVEKDPDGEHPEVIIEGAALDDTGGNVIDGNTGQVSTAPGADAVSDVEGQKAKDKNKP